MIGFAFNQSLLRGILWDLHFGVFALKLISHIGGFIVTSEERSDVALVVSKGSIFY
jgi:hypothetical protein